MSMAIVGGGRMWVATIDDGEGNRETTDPFAAADEIVARAEAALRCRDDYDSRCRVVDVKQHHPLLDMIERGRP